MSRGGVGFSWGIPGLRISKGANGLTWISIGIPGTGLYFTKRLIVEPRQTQQEPLYEGTADKRGNHTGIKEWKDLK